VSALWARTPAGANAASAATSTNGFMGSPAVVF
jgi:hypothetical protein